MHPDMTSFIYHVNPIKEFSSSRMLIAAFIIYHHTFQEGRYEERYEYSDGINGYSLLVCCIGFKDNALS
jgi:hypothetical protein